MSIHDLSAAAAEWREQAARLLLDCFRGRSPAWPDLAAARAEVDDSLQPGRLSRVWIAEGAVAGWIGGQPQYDGHVWELHPLVVSQAHRGSGIGAALVRDLESAVAARGALTLWVGADDENFETSLGGVDLYDDLPARLREVRGGGAHPCAFYGRMGFQIVGVMPDANGRGKPDIFMAKRVGR
jgi:aminoglycoside 6'-N-acetyltransferase I